MDGLSAFYPLPLSGPVLSRTNRRVESVRVPPRRTALVTGVKPLPASVLREAVCLASPGVDCGGLRRCRFDVFSTTKR
jgi:hypothetical protein